MTYRELGRRGPKVSSLGFGCMRFPVKDGAIDRDESTQMIHEAIEAGVNYLDTAYPYHNGESEKFLGEILTGSLRSRVTLATKMPTWELKKPDDLDRIFDEQRERLRTDRFDVYLLHALGAERWENTVLPLGALEWLAAKKESGEVRYTGFSFHDDYPAFETILDAWDWDVCQVQYNYMDVENQAGRKGLQRAHARGVGVIVMEPLLGGNLVTPPPSVQEVWTRSTHSDWSPVERALRWLWDQEAVHMVLSGMSSLEQLRENIAIASSAGVDDLDDDERALFEKAREAYAGLKLIGCTACEYCLPCPHDVAIPQNFSLVNDAARFGDIEKSRGGYAWMLKSFEMGLSEKDGRAVHCISCGECVPKCPQGLEIDRLMPEAAAVLGGEKELEAATF